MSRPGSVPLRQLPKFGSRRGTPSDGGPIRGQSPAGWRHALHHLHHRPTRPDVTGPPAGFPTFLPTPPIRGHKRERAERPPRRPTRADSPTLRVNEKARLDFEAGLEFLFVESFIGDSSRPLGPRKALYKGWTCSAHPCHGWAPTTDRDLPHRHPR